MKIVDFPQTNFTYAAGDIPDCDDLRVFKYDDGCISLWELSGDELAQILQSKRIWLRVRGSSHPPVSLEVDDLENPMFYGGDAEEEDKQP